MGKPTRKVEEALIREGWKTLVKKMGVAKATRFPVKAQTFRSDPVNCLIYQRKVGIKGVV